MKSLLVILRLILALTGGLATSALSAEDGVPAITVTYAPNILALPLFTALETGAFRRHGVEVKLQRAEQANIMISSVVAGTADVATGVSLLPVLNLETQSPGKLHVVVHSRMTDAAPFDSLLVRAGADIKRLKDLEGRKVAVYQGSTARAILAEFLRRHEVDVSLVQFVQLPGNAHANALAAGVVDSAFTYEPVTTALLLGGTARRLHGSVYASLQNEACPISVTVFSRESERSKRDAMVRFQAGLEDGIRFVREHPEEARQCLARFTNVTPEIAARVSIVEDATAAEASPAALQEFINLMVQLGESAQGVTADSLLAPTR